MAIPIPAASMALPGAPGVQGPKVFHLDVLPQLTQPGKHRQPLSKGKVKPTDHDHHEISRYVEGLHRRNTMKHAEKT